MAGSSTSTATASTCPTSRPSQTLRPRSKQSPTRPPLPVYQWCARPDAGQTTANKWLQESNYAQALEGNIDSSHVGFLHKTFEHPTFRSGGRLESTQQVTATRETDFGFVYGARRDTSD